MLAPSIARIKARFGRPPKAVTADRGYGEAAVDKSLTDLGVTTVAIPRRGRPGPDRAKTQRQKGFVRLVKWRTGSEARISCLKRDWGWRRSLYDSHTGAQIWCGWGVLSHNATKIAALSTAAGQPTATRRPPGSDPPTASDAPAAA